jgi:hypothetical protein
VDGRYGNYANTRLEPSAEKGGAEAGRLLPEELFEREVGD